MKLRAGGVVDSEDLARGWLVGRFTKHHDLDEEEEPALGRTGAGAGVGGGQRREREEGGNKWGRRGISVSADEGVHDMRPEGVEARKPLTDPEAFEDELTDDEDAPPPAAAAAGAAGVGNGSEWRDEDEDDDERRK